MATIAGHASEWTAAPMRPTATWVPVTGSDGRTRLEMVWSVPAIEALDVAGPPAGTSARPWAAA
jgi:hypothetical protein